MEKRFEFKRAGISDVYLITMKQIEDNRGGIVKTFSKEIFGQNGISFSPNEEIIIKSSKNVLRGLHFQKGEGQAKLVRLVDGKLFCVILDINKDSNTFGKWVSIWLDDEYKEIFVPRDCALGTFAVADSVFSCYSDGKYVAKDCSGIIWNDTDLNIDWPLKREPVLSKKDQDLCKFVEYKKYEG